MIRVKVLILIVLPLATLAAAYAAWSHQQHVAAAAVKSGLDRLVVPNQAEQIQQFKDR